MQQGGSSASDSRPVPPEESLLGRPVVTVVLLHSWQPQDKEEIIEPDCMIEKVEGPKAEVRDSDWIIQDESS